jgi:small subunit ribosomal protein S16
MLKIRLQRVGRKNDPSFRIVVTERTNATRSGKFLEIVGAYDVKKGGVELNADRIKYWLSKGAQATGTVHNMLVRAKVIDAKKIAVAASARRKKPEVEVKAAAPVAVTA